MPLSTKDRLCIAWRSPISQERTGHVVGIAINVETVFLIEKICFFVTINICAGALCVPFQ